MGGRSGSSVGSDEPFRASDFAGKQSGGDRTPPVGRSTSCESDREGLSGCPARPERREAPGWKLEQRFYESILESLRCRVEGVAEFSQTKTVGEPILLVRGVAKRAGTPLARARGVMRILGEDLGHAERFTFLREVRGGRSAFDPVDHFVYSSAIVFR